MAEQLSLGEATPFINPFSSNGKVPSNLIGNELYIEPDAKRFFHSLNGYEKAMVAKGIEALRSIKNPPDGASHRLRPNFWKLKRDPGVVGHYLIAYEIFGKRVVVTAIYHNEAVLRKQSRSKDERNALYQVQRLNSTRYDNGFIPNTRNINRLKNSWGEGIPVTRVETTHAAVNGMLNDYEKATWLMGVHTDFAYPGDGLQDYTLFHNPTESFFPDLYECLQDQIGATTENAKHLSAVLRKIQHRGKPVKWLVHSQGGIIFKEAVRYHLKHYGGSLSHNSVIFHAGGNNKAKTDALLQAVGIKKNAADNDNPLDLVPNITGMNDLSRAGRKQSLVFSRKVIGTPGQKETESPHTLPFISLEFYRRMLIHGGEYKLAQRVKNIMSETGIA